MKKFIQAIVIVTSSSLVINGTTPFVLDTVEDIDTALFEHPANTTGIFDYENDNQNIIQNLSTIGGGATLAYLLPLIFKDRNNTDSEDHDKEIGEIQNIRYSASPIRINIPDGLFDDNNIYTNTTISNCIPTDIDNLLKALNDQQEKFVKLINAVGQQPDFKLDEKVLSITFSYDKTPSTSIYDLSAIDAAVLFDTPVGESTRESLIGWVKQILEEKFVHALSVPSDMDFSECLSYALDKQLNQIDKVILKLFKKKM